MVDNASVDGTAAVVRDRFPAVELLPLARNIGAAARTLGAARANAPYVAFADDDSWWAPGALTRAADVLDAFPRLALIAGRILVGADEREDTACVQMARSPLAPRDSLPGPRVLGFVACGAVVRRSAFLAVGGFHRRLQTYGEEALLAVDLTAAGWSLSYVEDVVAHHHPAPERDDELRRRVEARNRLWFSWLRRPFAAALGATVPVVRAAVFDPATRLGTLDALRGARWVVRERRPVARELELALRAVT